MASSTSCLSMACAAVRGGPAQWPAALTGPWVIGILGRSHRVGQYRRSDDLLLARIDAACKAPVRPSAALARPPSLPVTRRFVGSRRSLYEPFT